MVIPGVEDTGADLNEPFNADRMVTIGDFLPKKPPSRVTESPFRR